MMNQTTEADTPLSRFIQSLSSRYYEQQEVQSLMTKQMQYGIAEIPMIYEPGCTCTFPCLSLRSGPRHRTQKLLPQGEIDHELLQGLLGRTLQYSAASTASSALLKNLVSSFGHILELELQRRIYNLAKKLERSKNTEANRHKKEAIYKAFEEQSLSNESPAVPVSAVTNFFTTSSRNDGCEDTAKQTTVTDIIFEARIRLHLTPHCAPVNCRLRTPGVITVQSFPRSKIFDTLDLKLDMDELYIAIRKECKYVSKQIINGIVGFNIFEKKSRDLKQQQTTDETRTEQDCSSSKDQMKQQQTTDESRNEQDCSSSKDQLEHPFTGSDVVTYSTVASIDEQSLDFLRTNGNGTYKPADQKSWNHKKTQVHAEGKGSVSTLDIVSKKKKNWLWKTPKAKTV